VARGYDVAVLGAGLVGCAAAYELARRGKRVIVVDQWEINRGASGRNAGSLHFQIEPRMLHLLREQPERLSQLITVNLQAIEDWRQLSRSVGKDAEVVMSGGVMVAESEAELTVLTEKSQLEIAAGLRVELIEGREVRRVAPYLTSDIRYAAFCGDEGHSNPRLITPAFATAATELGCQFSLQTQVMSLEPIGQGWRLKARPTSQSAASPDSIAIDAGMILMAAGAWAREILEPLGFNTPLTAHGLQMNVTQRTRSFMTHLVQHVGQQLSIKQLESGNVLIGGGWPATLSAQPLGNDPAVNILESSLYGNMEVALRVVPGIGSLDIIRSWTGISSVAPDHLPVLGPVQSLPGIFIAAGGSSFTLGPTYARLIAELMSGGSTTLPLELYRPERFTVARQIS
jgi:sarcosine oxidase, subunit beta